MSDGDGGGEVDPRLEAISAARDAFWAEWGFLDPNLWTNLVNPGFQGFPMWPGVRQAYRVARRGSLTLLATDGLADPYDDDTDDEVPGLGLEFFAVTKDELRGDVGDWWLYDLLFQVAATAADHGRLRPLIEKFGTMSLECHDVDVPSSWRTESGTVGVLLGAQQTGGPGIRRTIDVPPDGVLAVNVKLLTPDELAFVAERGAEGRVALMKRLDAVGQQQRSGLDRTSVLP